MALEVKGEKRDENNRIRIANEMAVMQHVTSTTITKKKKMKTERQTSASAIRF